MSQVQVFGIRHHGPGSAKRLVKALKSFKPDCLLVEAPLDSEAVLQQVNQKGLKPPVAILLYHPKDFAQAAYLPFANFSPEWQAVLYALKAEIPVKAMDLPMGIQLLLREAEDPLLKTHLDPELERLQLDPLGYMAKLAGYEDSERWWEVTFEQEEDDLQLFEGILELMHSLRADSPRIERQETLLREAHMRKILRKTQKEGYERIAIVCGAWHAPVLDQYQNFKQKDDLSALRGLSKINLKACWIPWSYERLARQSGYGAGVISPAWYELLFSRRQETTIRWMTRVARLLRKEDLDASAANVIEAVRLAETLATLRGLQVPGIDELEAAAMTVFTDGDASPLRLIRERLVIGDQVGKVPPGMSLVPLQRDFEKMVKKARLSASYQSSETISKELDLRKSTQALASALLHQLNLLNIPWGNERKLSGRELGAFKEKWRLKWRPDYTIRLIQASMYGNTLLDACDAYAWDRAQQESELPTLLQLLGQVLKAQRYTVAVKMLDLIRNAAAQSQDVIQLMEAVPSLVNILRYGSTRATEQGFIRDLLGEILPRIFFGLPRACFHLEEDPARDIFRMILEVNSSLEILGVPQLVEQWFACLEEVIGADQAHPLLQGLAVRRLFEAGFYVVEQTKIRLLNAVSKAQEPAAKALWLEGFLYGNALLLVYHTELWEMIDNWIKQVPESAFFEILPILRRTFSPFSQTERGQLLQLAKGVSPASEMELILDFDPERVALLEASLRFL